MQPMLNIALRAARSAGEMIYRSMERIDVLTVDEKDARDYVTEIDRTAEQTIIAQLRKAYPDHSIQAEESGFQPGQGDGADTVWIIDPLDGTTNFLHGIPHFAISIALERDGDIFAGVIYNPVVDELYAAEKGCGAFMNGRRLRVSARKDLDQALFATGIPFKGVKDHPAFLKQLEAVMACTAGIRRFGAASLDLAYVAAGKYDGFWETALQPWDIAAGIILVREAGGFVTEIDGGTKMLESGSILAGNDPLHGSLAKLLRETASKSSK